MKKPYIVIFVGSKTRQTLNKPGLVNQIHIPVTTIRDFSHAPEAEEWAESSIDLFLDPQEPWTDRFFIIEPYDELSIKCGAYSMVCERVQVEFQQLIGDSLRIATHEYWGQERLRAFALMQSKLRVPLSENDFSVVTKFIVDPFVKDNSMTVSGLEYKYGKNYIRESMVEVVRGELKKYYMPPTQSIGIVVAK